jgi:hypothetical protein
MDYDDQGRQRGRELLEDTDPAPYVRWQQIALAHALPYAEYVTLLGWDSTPSRQAMTARASPALYPKDIDHYHALASFFGGYALWDDAARSFIAKVADCSRNSRWCPAL